ncbi:STAS domain-containing protein [Nonomuraea sp. NN258]|uniref:STAS domain-containing protein n=1 Tax=Nonomuraea antri TaxID=2730852 RepID=UPI00156852B2|nr:STAS domain-containing protein [Nonomuraea antri]NRQ32428.1 STAS domain-containing protein [Nonomuraea antri]
MGALPEPSSPRRPAVSAGAASAGAAPLTCQRLPGISVVAIAGDIDRTSSGHLADQLQQVLRPGDHVVLDLSELTFLDSSGLHVLLACHRQCAAQQRSLHLAAVRGMPARLLRITGVDQHLPVHADVQQALTVLLANPADEG